MRHPIAALLIAAVIPLAACEPAAEGGTTTTPRPHVVAGVDSDALSEGERLYLDELLPKAPSTTAGASWKKSVTSATKSDLDTMPLLYGSGFGGRGRLMWMAWVPVWVG